MTQRFYLHDATTSLTGTLPGSTNLTGVTLNVTATGASTNRTMDGIIGVSQVSQALTTAAISTIQRNWFRRFLSGRLAAQTITNPSFSISVGASESNTNSDMFEDVGNIAVGVWRTSNGTLLTWNGGSQMRSADTSPGPGLTEPTTSQSVSTGGRSFTDFITILDNDVLVVEWFSNQTQSMATGYTNTVFYDGTTQGSATNIAAYIDFGIDIALYVERVPYRNPMPPLIAQSVVYKERKKFTFLDGLRWPKVLV